MFAGRAMSRFSEEDVTMASLRASNEARRRSFGHVVGSISTAERFPSQVFLGNWRTFLFCEFVSQVFWKLRSVKTVPSETPSHGPWPCQTRSLKRNVDLRVAPVGELLDRLALDAAEAGAMVINVAQAGGR